MAVTPECPLAAADWPAPSGVAAAVARPVAPSAPCRRAATGRSHIGPPADLARRANRGALSRPELCTRRLTGAAPWPLAGASDPRPAAVRQAAHPGGQRMLAHPPPR